MCKFWEGSTSTYQPWLTPYNRKFCIYIMHCLSVLPFVVQLYSDDNKLLIFACYCNHCLVKLFSGVISHIIFHVLTVDEVIAAIDPKKVEILQRYAHFLCS